MDVVFGCSALRIATIVVGPSTLPKRSNKDDYSIGRHLICLNPTEKVDLMAYNLVKALSYS